MYEEMFQGQRKIKQEKISPNENIQGVYSRNEIIQNEAIPCGIEQTGRKDNKKGCLRLVLFGVCAFLWWCLLYPELCFPDDVYEPVYGIEEKEVIDSGEEKYTKLLQADGEEIIVKSRLLELWKQHKN